MLSSDPVTVTYHIKLGQAITTATDTPISQSPLTTTVATSLSAHSLMHMLYLFTHIFTSVKWINDEYFILLVIHIDFHSNEDSALDFIAHSRYSINFQLITNTHSHTHTQINTHTRTHWDDLHSRTNKRFNGTRATNWLGSQLTNWTTDRLRTRSQGPRNVALVRRTAPAAGNGNGNGDKIVVTTSVVMATNWKCQRGMINMP